MSNNVPSLKSLSAWQNLSDLHSTIKDMNMRDVFAADPKRAESYSVELDGMVMDFSKNLVTGDIMNALLALAKARDLEGWRDQMFSGSKINNTEKLILEKMIRSSGKVFSREEIGKLININKERSIDVIITRLRQKVETDSKNPQYLQTIRGSGYVLWIE